MSDVRVVESLTGEQARWAHDLVVSATVADGVEPLSEQGRLAIDGTGDSTEGVVRHVLSSHGYAVVLVSPGDGAAMIEAVVDPGHRRHGHGRELVREAFAQARLLGVEANIWAHGDLPGAAALAASLGLSRNRELLQLRRPAGDGSDLPEQDLDASIELRTYAGPGDDAEILRVNNAAFDWHPEQGGWSLLQIHERTGSDWFDPAGLFLACDRKSLQLWGFHWTKMQSPELGEVYIVGVDPAAQGRGLGRLLTLAGLYYFVRVGVSEVMLYVEGDNTAALNTYEKLGFTRYAVDVAYGVPAPQR
ncbi:mycothiol synthase [Gordonia sp. (in: high G+C Gram-positive bacteria)]|jgi:mycothiol synthase|uniref:mycothiol synthase n=1 Tax=Gordonia sp. (in: high G+C Gram-positive bacteria) TaxID=84139 RepID=UPI001DB16D76|nr:mycothiol synthase [Gordonia sp. (in: high G+C Gram-positive bacteria)]MCB1295560.1 mycothiol synthase [Gordonia sp. (in: high G+C Gram-positive bacteria)]HMS76448.1 mycothiol synthase [Gordonia sp. (in: high G+C Gram-positive bacteria)]